ncbi:3-keto-5-aminohexanoate cleavage protein [Rhizorhabdus histidinilytica]
MKKKVIIEVALNETVMRCENPHVPLTPEEIAEDAYQCYREGASIIHFHNRVPDKPDDGTYDSSLAGSAEHYADTMRLIRARCDVIPYPTYTYPGRRPRGGRARHASPRQGAARDARHPAGNLRPPCRGDQYRALRLRGGALRLRSGQLAHP